MPLPFIKLPGPYTYTTQVPQQCAQCGCKDLFVQPDFKRSIGLTMVTIASILTVILATQGYGWFVIWSPFFVSLVIDRVLAHINPVAVLCYRCEHIHRGVVKQEAVQKFEAFDLEICDRYKYADRVSTET